MSDYQEQEYGREGGGGDRGAKKEPGPDEVKLFVGNLSFETTEDDLRDLFSKYGTVTYAKVITDRDSGRPRGFGFVSMSNRAEADEAISKAAGYDLQGREIRVDESAPRGSAPPRGGRGGGGGGYGDRNGGGGGYRGGGGGGRDRDYGSSRGGGGYEDRRGGGGYDDRRGGGRDRDERGGGRDERGGGRDDRRRYD